MKSKDYNEEFRKCVRSGHYSNKLAEATWNFIRILVSKRLNNYSDTDIVDIVTSEIYLETHKAIRSGINKTKKIRNPHQLIRTIITKKISEYIRRCLGNDKELDYLYCKTFKSGGVKATFISIDELIEIEDVYDN